MNSAGIDYGLGKANVDKETGIRYGVIRINALHEFIHDELESDYGDPSCPKCGNSVCESGYGKDYICLYCLEVKHGYPESDLNEFDKDPNQKFIAQDVTYWSDEVFSDEPMGSSISGKYDAHSAFDSTCLFLTKSPYYTFTQFCSPCAPGAGDLDNPLENGVKTLCFGPEMFDDDKAPYPVYRVSDDSLVE